MIYCPPAYLSTSLRSPSCLPALFFDTTQRTNVCLHIHTRNMALGWSFFLLNPRHHAMPHQQPMRRGAYTRTQRTYTAGLGRLGSSREGSPTWGGGPHQRHIMIPWYCTMIHTYALGSHTCYVPATRLDSSSCDPRDTPFSLSLALLVGPRWMGWGGGGAMPLSCRGQAKSLRPSSAKLDQTRSSLCWMLDCRPLDLDGRGLSQVCLSPCCLGLESLGYVVCGGPRRGHSIRCSSSLELSTS